MTRLLFLVPNSWSNTVNNTINDQKNLFLIFQRAFTVMLLNVLLRYQIYRARQDRVKHDDG